MSADEITDTVINNIKSKKYNIIIVNYANPDMVGHTGNFNATVKSIEKIDSCIEKLIKYTQEYNIITVITADHGNAEEMILPNGEPMTSHTCNPVPFAIHNYNQTIELPKNGKLKDISPIICKLLEINT